MIILSQRNPFWSTLHLGSSPLTVGRYGCTTTCIAMISDYFGHYKSPLCLAQQPGLYDAAGKIIWSELNHLFLGMVFEKRVYGRNDALIKESLADKDKAVILEVDHGQHWVVALGKTLIRNDYRIADPWFGDKSTAVGRYHNITGSAHFKRAS